MEYLTVEELIAKIKNAWRELPYPGDENIFTPHSYDDEGITEYFSGTTWEDHSVEELRAHCAAFTFFTPIAYRYWLPAFLMAWVLDPEELDVCVDALLDSFDAVHEPEKIERLALLTKEQILAVIATIEFIIQRETILLGYSASEDEITALTYLRSIIS